MNDTQSKRTSEESDNTNDYYVKKKGFYIYNIDSFIIDDIMDQVNKRLENKPNKKKKKKRKENN